jgi:hypothetical protein
VKHVNCPWHPLEAPLSVLNFSLFLVIKKTIFRIIKTKRPPSMPNHKFFENVYLEKLLFVVQ